MKVDPFRYQDAEAAASTVHALNARVERDSNNVRRAQTFRSVKNYGVSEDQSGLVKILLSVEAADITRKQLEGLGESVDELYGKVLYYQTLYELELSYGYLYMRARKEGWYKKQFASFIQWSQEQRDGQTCGWEWNGTEEDLDYSILFATMNDYRSDEEHEARVMKWQKAHGM